MAKSALDRNYERMQKLNDRALGIYLGVWRNHWSHERILAYLKEDIYDADIYKRLPRWAKSEIDGYLDALMNVTLSWILEWRVELDGKYIQGGDVPKGAWSRVGHGKYFYQGTDVPFSED